MQPYRVAVMILLWSLFHKSSSVVIDSSSFLNQLQSLTNGYLGISRFQQFIDEQRNAKLSFLYSVPNGQRLVEQIASDIDANVQRYITAVRKIQSAHMNGSEVNQIELDPCCNFTRAANLVYDLHFKRQVDVASMCHLTDYPMRVNSAVKEAMITNLQTLPIIRWQYYSTEDGRHGTYPARNLCGDAKGFDPRKRPWYTATVNRPKDIVILIDRSSPMNNFLDTSSTKLKLEVAKSAATAILQYMNPNDRVALLAYSESILSLNSTSCFAKELAVATANNLQQISDFVETGFSADGNGRARLSVALTEASRIFNSTNTNTTKGLYSDSDKVILVLTDGNQIDDCQTLKNLETQLFNDTVNIFILGVGLTGMTEDKISCLRLLAAGPRGAQGSVPNADIKDLRGQLGFYYNAFIDTIDKTNATVSVPFRDVNIQNLDTSICLPLFRMDQSLGGVTCVELAVNDLFQDVVNFRLGKLSYGFVIDRKGRVILHPLLPKPAGWSDQPTLLEMNEVEMSSYASDIESNILSGVAGNRTVNVKWFAPLGQSIMQGVKTFETTASYYWRSIPSARLFVCLVFLQNETSSNLTWNANDLPDVFLSDEIDLNPPGKCNFFGRISIANKTVVKLAPKAFIYPGNYTDRDITTADIQQLKAYIARKGSMPDKLGLEAGIRDIVASTNFLDAIWLQNVPGSDQQHILSMYIGTTSGVYRRFPPFRIPTTYDPTQQPWYVTGSAQTGAVSFALPFLDNASSIPVVSISQTIWNGNPQVHTASDSIFGVMGMDLTVKHLHALMTSTFTECNSTGNECFAIDLSGFVIIHKTLQDTLPNGSLHIAAIEPTIAADMVSQGILSNDSCVNYVDQPLTKQLFWKVTILFGKCVELKKTKASICEVQMSDSSRNSVSTNIFIIVKTQQTGGSGTCACGNLQSESYTCTYDETVKSCQCPCRLPVNYDTCLASLIIDPFLWKPCIPSGSLPIQPDLLNETLVIPVLQSCISCITFADRQLCTANQCYWSQATLTCSSTPPPTAPPTQAPDLPTGNTTQIRPSTSNDHLIPGLPVGLAIGVAAIIALGVLVFCCYRKRNKKDISVVTQNETYESVICKKEGPSNDGKFITTIRIQTELLPGNNQPSGEDPPFYSDI